MQSTESLASCYSLMAGGYCALRAFLVIESSFRSLSKSECRDQRVLFAILFTEIAGDEVEDPDPEPIQSTAFGSLAFSIKFGCTIGVDWKWRRLVHVARRT